MTDIERSSLPGDIDSVIEALCTFTNELDVAYYLGLADKNPTQTIFNLLQKADKKIGKLYQGQRTAPHLKLLLSKALAEILSKKQMILDIFVQSDLENRRQEIVDLFSSWATINAGLLGRTRLN